MLIRRGVLEAIAAGQIASSPGRGTSRRCAGGTRRTPVGVLAIDAVDPLAPAALTSEDARVAGYQR